jgi:hypothetical protein
MIFGKQIIPDGHCLYNAIAHQLNVCKRRDDTTETHDYKELRRIAGDYMLANGEQFMPFLTDQTGMDMIGQQDYEQYCHNVSNSAEWGGQLEVNSVI